MIPQTQIVLEDGFIGYLGKEINLTTLLLERARVRQIFYNTIDQNSYGGYNFISIKID